MTIQVTPRGGRGMNSKFLPAPFYALDLSTTSAWGSRPGEARARYIGIPGVPPVPIMCQVHVGWDNHAWTGICLDDQMDFSDSSGRIRSLRIVDTRQFLEWDTVFAAYNQRDNRIVNGVMERRYWHVLPKDYVSGKRTFTRKPFTGREVLQSVFGFTRSSGSPHYTVETRWRLNLHRILTREPVLDLDWTRGATLQQIAQEVADRLGLVVGVVPEDPWTLRLERKGYGAIPYYPETGSSFPPSSNERRVGWSYSGTPTRVRVVGERSVYQIMDIELVPDWLPTWELFMNLDEFQKDLFYRAQDSMGRHLSHLPNDTDHAQGWFLAAAMAREITVGQYAALRKKIPMNIDAVPAKEWRDTGLWQGQKRTDMPVALYLSRILFRSFKPKDKGFPVGGSVSGPRPSRTPLVPLESLEVLPRLLAAVSHDPISGRMQVDSDSPTDGNGYVIAQGYQIGLDGLLTVQPEFFQLATWRSLQSLWQSVPFTVDQSAEQGLRILFSEPMILSENLVDMVDGLPVIRADAIIRVPRVRAALVFAAEVFQHIEGVGPRDRVELVAGLGPEFILSASGATKAEELPYADGQTALYKARRVARAILEQPPFSVRGGYRTPGMSGQRLHALLDRVSCVVSAQGSYEEVEFSTERLPATYESERRFDRIRREQLLMPGQAELKAESRALRMLASATRASPGVVQGMQAFLRGTSEPPVALEDVTNDTPVLAVGTPLWGWESNPGAPSRPSASPGIDQNRFFGATTREEEQPNGLIPVRSTGMINVRVKGPVQQNQSVGKPRPVQVDEGDWQLPVHLVAGGVPIVGLAQSSVPDGEIRLIKVLVSGAEPGLVKAMRKFRINRATTMIEQESMESFGPPFTVQAILETANSTRPEPLTDWTVYEINIPNPGPLIGAQPRVTFSFLTEAGNPTDPVTILRAHLDNTAATPNPVPFHRWYTWGESMIRRLDQMGAVAAVAAEDAARFYAQWAAEGWASPNSPALNVPDAPPYRPREEVHSIHLRADMITVEFL